MPRLSEFYGITISMYFNDHAPPHFHAYYSGRSALIGIETREVIVGSLPDRALRLVKEWAELHQGELRANWAIAQVEGDLQRIEGLR